MAHNDFTPLNENELQRLSSNDLIAYIRKAVAADRPDCAEAALGILCFRHFDDVRRRVSLRTPERDVEDVAMEVMASAVKSAFDGKSVGQFVSWLNTIVSRRIADYHRKAEGEPSMYELLEERPENDEGSPRVVLGRPGDEGEIHVRQLAEECADELGMDSHRRVIDLYVYDDLDAETTTATVNAEFSDLDPPMTPTNVHQIARRFRKCLKDKLAEADGL